MIIPHDGHDVSYLFVVATYKSSLEMRFRKVVPANDPRLKEPIYYPPELEFNEEEQTYFQVYFIGFLEGLFESMSAIRSIETKNKIPDCVAHFQRRPCCATAQTRRSPKSCARAAGW
jgi:hypothetical protein